MDGPLSVTSMIEQDRQISEIVAEERSRLRNFIRRRVPDPSIRKDAFGWPTLSAVSAERVALLSARSDHVGGLPFASLFVFMDLTPAPYSHLLSFQLLVSAF